MKISPNSASRAALALVIAAGAGLPVLGQDTPESLLPPGFDDPAPAPAPRPTRAAPTPSPTRAAPATPAPADSPVAQDDALAGNTVEAMPTPRATIDLSRFDVPEFARRSLDRVGATAASNQPIAPDAFGRAGGRYLATLMQRMDAPVASRWLSIGLRRALMSPIDTPAGIGGADFAAQRAWLLLRMGEAVAARAVVQSVDVSAYTPLMYRVAQQVALATGDVAAMCPIADAAAERLPERGWKLAQAMCAGLAGAPKRAVDLLKQGQRPGGPDIDSLLAEKALGFGADSRRSVTIEWDGVDRLSAWRYGLAIATGTEIPDALYGSAGPQVRYWYALSPAPAPRARAVAAELAAAQGVFSNAGLVDLYGEIAEQDDSGSAEAAIARDLRTAHAAGRPSDRLAAMVALWDEAQSARTQYARLVLTARAAATLAPDRAMLDDAGRVIASMLTAGLVDPALAWERVVPRATDGWALLTLADPSPARRVSYSDADAYRGAASGRKGQLYVAAITGLGRLSVADARRAAASAGVEVGAANRWTQAINAAARRGDEATVLLLAAVGMQARNWDRVSPETLFHIVASLRVAGLEAYARMIAAEALTRA